MSAEIIQITAGQLALGLVFIVIAGLLSILHSLKLEKDLLVGTLRTFVQLFLLGYALKIIFKIDRAWLVAAVFLIMVLFAAWTILGRVRERQVSFSGLFSSPWPWAIFWFPSW